jgi:hypothetical protein
MTELTYLNRDDILKPRDLKVEEVDVPEWGGIVRIRELTGEGQNAFQASLRRTRPNGQTIMDQDGNPILDLTNASAKLLVRAIVGDDGEPLLSLADVDALGQESGAVLERVALIARRLSGMTDEAVDDAEGNSDAAPSGDSTSI